MTQQDAADFHAKVLKDYKASADANSAIFKNGNTDSEGRNQFVKETYDVYYAMHKEYSADWHKKHIDAVSKVIEERKDIMILLARVVTEAQEPLLDNDYYANAIHVILNVTKLSVPLAKWVPANLPLFMRKLYDTLGAYSSNSNPSTDIQGLIIRNLKVVYSFTLRDENIPVLQNMKFDKVLLPYLSFPATKIMWPTMLCLAYLIEENECQYLAGGSDVMNYFHDIFRRTLSSPSRTAKDENNVNWAAWEMGRLIDGLARNDGNKTLLVEKGFLPLLVEMARSTKSSERKNALKSIRSLSFNDNNKSKIEQEPGLVPLVKELKEKADVKEICNGILWNISQAKPASSSVAPVAPKKPEQVRPVSARKGHVMISYQWANQATLIKIRDKLTSIKERVWMDIDEMEGSTLQAMAEAVEQADIVLICVSRKYKESHNCRTEAEYAHRLKKPIIPLIMEQGYVADGWLGMLMGSQLYFDFSGKYNFEDKLSELLKAVRKRRDKMSDDGPSGRAAPSGAGSGGQNPRAVSHPQQDVRSWSSTQVKDWLRRHDLSGGKLDSLTGKQIASLIKLKAVPDQYYDTLKNELGLSLLSLDSFDEALEELC